MMSPEFIFLSMGRSMYLSPVRAAAGAVVTESVTATGQIHHLFTKKIMVALSKHRTLKGIFSRNDTKYIYNALDDAAHRGYQTWHRQYDDIVVDWLQNYPEATPAQFNQFLHNIYQEPWLKSRIPNVNLLK